MISALPLEASFSHLGLYVKNLSKMEKIHLVGGSSLTQLYAEALTLAEIEVQQHSGDDLVRLGLTAAWRFLYS